MANKKHVAILKSGVEAWNKWREENPDEQPDLTKANLVRANLSKANLNNADLSEARLIEADLSEAYLFEADLSKAYLAQANLIRANLSGVNLSGAKIGWANLSEANLSELFLTDRDYPNLSETDIFRESGIWEDLTEGEKYRYVSLNEADLSGAELHAANLSKTDLSKTDLSNAILSEADLSGAELHAANLSKTDLSKANLNNADLSEADLGEADLSEADLSGANLSGAYLGSAFLTGSKLNETTLNIANLQDADLRGTRGLILDCNFVRGAQFDVRAKDPWSVLRRTYSGPRLMFNLLFLVAFLIPYVAKILFWASINRVQAYTEAVVGERASVLGLDAGTISDFSRCLAKQCESVSVWQLILGIDKGWPFLTLAVALITYNLLKAGLTWVVAPMRDEEERSGHTSNWVGERWWQGYRPLSWAHQVVRFMFWIAVFAFVYNGYDWLSRTVWIPG